MPAGDDDRQRGTTAPPSTRRVRGALEGRNLDLAIACRLFLWEVYTGDELLPLLPAIRPARVTDAWLRQRYRATEFYVLDTVRPWKAFDAAGCPVLPFYHRDLESAWVAVRYLGESFPDRADLFMLNLVLRHRAAHHATRVLWDLRPEPVLLAVLDTLGLS